MKVNKGMDRSFHYLLLAAQGLFQRTTMAELSGMDLTEEQYRVLDYLGQHDGSLQKYIAAGCQLEPAAAATALDPEAVHAMRDGLAEVCLSLAAGREELQ